MYTLFYVSLFIFLLVCFFAFPFYPCFSFAFERNQDFPNHIRYVHNVMGRGQLLAAERDLDDIKRWIGVFVAEKRRGAHITQETLAEKAGCDVSTIKRLEAGSLNNIRTLFATLTSLRVDIEEFCFYLIDRNGNLQRNGDLQVLLEKQEHLIRMMEKIDEKLTPLLEQKKE